MYMEKLSSGDIATIRQWLGTGSINIFGLPFSGKDTHGHTLANLFGATVLSGGDILRNSVIPEHVRTLIDAGNLAPTDDYIRIVLPYLSKSEFSEQPLVLSTVGRWHGEEPGVMGVAEAAGHPIKAVLYLYVSEDTSHERFLASRTDEKRGIRADDTEEKLATRYLEFYDKTMPVIQFYRDKGLLIEIDGRPPKDEVSTTILYKLLELAKQED